MFRSELESWILVRRALYPGRSATSASIAAPWRYRLYLVEQGSIERGAPGSRIEGRALAGALIGVSADRYRRNV
jgi:hypothetical protein